MVKVPEIGDRYYVNEKFIDHTNWIFTVVWVFPQGNSTEYSVQIKTDHSQFFMSSDNFERLRYFSATLIRIENDAHLLQLRLKYEC